MLNDYYYLNFFISVSNVGNCFSFHSDWFLLWFSFLVALLILLALFSSILIGTIFLQGEGKCNDCFGLFFSLLVVVTFITKTNLTLIGLLLY
jgi:hypothetical protein